MTRTLILLTSVAALAACEPGGTAADPFSIEAEACSDVQAIVTASAEAVPFESLRTAPATWPDGDTIDGSWITSATLDGRFCTLNAVGAFFGDGDVQVLRCTYDDNAQDDAEARETFAEADAYMRQCLSKDWEREDKTDPEKPGLSAIYERQFDRDRAEGADFYAYPIQIEYKVPDNGFGVRHRRDPSVSVAFQFSGDAETSPRED